MDDDPSSQNLSNADNDIVENNLNQSEQLVEDNDVNITEQVVDESNLQENASPINENNININQNVDEANIDTNGALPAEDSNANTVEMPTLIASPINSEVNNDNEDNVQSRADYSNPIAENSIVEDSNLPNAALNASDDNEIIQVNSNPLTVEESNEQVDNVSPVLEVDQITSEVTNTQDTSSATVLVEESVEDTQTTKVSSSKGSPGVDEGETTSNYDISDQTEIVEEKGIDEPLIPENFYYDSDQYVYKPHISEDSGIPANILQLHHSFGYDCMKRSNLHILDELNVVFITGNLTVILNIKTKEHVYLKCSGGGAFGAICVHPDRKHFAVAEKCENPNVLIFEYPSLQLYRILREGTEEAFAYLSFDPTGKMLASLGRAPDYTLTLWNWKQEAIVLRSKAFSQDVFKVTFSPDLEGILTTSGSGHIKFWKMANTFTGLKLQGEIGRFGKTEISDVEGYVELPDGKVLSGCDWGNMLLWEGGLIKVQLGRKNKRSCHTGPIQQFIMDEGELLTVGVDGYIRVWDFESIDQADTIDDTGMFEIEPMNELRVGNGEVFLKGIVKSLDEETIWYSQDSNGGIWRLDLSFSHTTKSPEKLFSFHSGTITGLDVSPITNLAATIGSDRVVRFYDFSSKQHICEERYSAPGCSLVWAPEKIDKNCSRVITGFHDGVVRVISVTKKEFDVAKRTKGESATMQLQQVFKPHNAAVNSLAITQDCELLATGSTDKTVFIFAFRDDKFEPVGFMDVPGPVQKLEWANHLGKEKRLLVLCRNGIAAELLVPKVEDVNTEKTYHISSVTKREVKFKSVKCQLRREEVKIRKEKEREERREKRKKERKKKIERGLIDPDEPEEESEPEEEEEEEPLFIPEESLINTGFYSKDGSKFWLSMDGYDAGYLYEYDFSQNSAENGVTPLRAVPVIDSDTPISAIFITKKMFFFGLIDGKIRVQPLENEEYTVDFNRMLHYWINTAHDNEYGAIQHLKINFDGNFLLSVGADGNFFVYTVMSQEEIMTSMAAAKLPSPRFALSEEATLKVEDIDDIHAYSIEDAKQKAERDRQMRLAEEKKTAVKKQIQAMRRNFRALLLENEAIPVHLRLPRTEFELDPQMAIDIENERGQRVEILHKELEWETCRKDIALRKVKDKFKSTVECELIIVKCFKTAHEVASFRAEKLPDGFYENKDILYEKASQLISLVRNPTKEKSNVRAGDDQTTEVVTDHAKPGKEERQGQVDEKAAKALGKMEKKRQKRRARQKEWEQLFLEKPSENYEDPKDVAAIAEAKANMGDFKLKTASDYIVPEHLRMNAVKKLFQLITLTENIYNYKHDFNRRLLALKFKKARLLGKIENWRHELKTIHNLLPNHLHEDLPFFNDLDEREVPEKKYFYNRDILIRFSQDSNQLADYAALSSSAVVATQNESDAGTYFSETHQSTKSGHASHGVHFTKKIAPKHKLTPPEPVANSEFENRVAKEQQIRLVYKQQNIIKSFNAALSTFDNHVMKLQKEKYEKEIDLKNADLRNITLFEELMLLKDFEKRENVLSQRVTTSMQEKTDIEEKVVETLARLERKKIDIERIQEKEKQLYADFLANLGENNKWTEFLTRVLKKKIKRAKKKEKTADGEEEDEDDSDDESDDSDFMDDSDDGETEVLDDSICPPGCEQELYDMACDLRNTRMDIEESLVEEKKLYEMIKKDVDGLQRKVKVVDFNLKSAEKDLIDFQLEKQGKLNELNVIVTLKCNQIEYLTHNNLPQDLSEAIVFQRKSLIQLQNRIKELHLEKAEQKNKYRENRLQHVELVKGRKLLDSKIKELDEECNKMMMLKFGRLVNLEELENVSVNRVLEELKEKHRQNESAAIAECKKWDNEIQHLKENITNLTRENTRRLNNLTSLLTKQRDLESQLDAQQRKLGGEYEEKRKSDVRERQRLVQLVQLQAQEIEALKEEIALLSRKGGHILPPTQPPMPIN